MMRKAEYEVGKGKPPKEHQFQRGDKGNPKGKTSAQKKAEMKAGELAAQIQMRMLEALNDAIKADPDRALSAIASDPLKLIKDAMDREFGTATQRTEVSGKDGMPIQFTEIRRTVVRPGDK